VHKILAPSLISFTLSPGIINDQSLKESYLVERNIIMELEGILYP